MSEGNRHVKVLSVVGAGRSGTTVLASILGEVEGVTSAGELRWLWERGVGEERPCGCGQPPRSCQVWGPVVETTRQRLAAGAPPRTISDLVVAQHELKRRRGFPRVLRTLGDDRSAPPSSQWSALRLVRDNVGVACQTLAATTDAAVVVDTSKRPLDAAVMAGIPGIDTYVLHVVRDARAVVHSWRRSKTFTTAGATHTMGTRGLTSTVRRWTGNAAYAELLRRRLPADRWLHLRYEDFAAHPRESVESVLTFLGEPGSAPFLDAHTARLHPNHIVAGNPSRFTTGDVSIRPDVAWQREMPIRDQRLVASMTLPLLLRYGYLGRTGAPAGDP
jgi:Sulfotransferase family